MILTFLHFQTKNTGKMKLLQFLFSMVCHLLSRKRSCQISMPLKVQEISCGNPTFQGKASKVFKSFFLFSQKWQILITLSADRSSKSSVFCEFAIDIFWTRIHKHSWQELSSNWIFPCSHVLLGTGLLFFSSFFFKKLKISSKMEKSLHISTKNQIIIQFMQQKKLWCTKSINW